MTASKGIDGHAPLRVVINGTHAKSGGGVTYLRNVLPKMAAMPDLELHLFLHKDQLELFYPVDENVNVTLSNLKSGFFRTLIWEQLAIPLYAWAMGADVVFSPANYGPIFARNHVILLRNALSVIQLTRRLGSVIYWLALTGATFISLLSAKKAIAVSQYAKNLMTFGFSRKLGKKIAVVHHGTHRIDPERMYSTTPGTYILAVSDIYIQKNYHALLHALAILIKRSPGLRLIIAGREIDHGYAQKLRSLSQELGIEENVIFAGHVETEELSELYRNCRVFVFPSQVETFGNPLLEAMAVGAPIACSNAAAMPEVLGDTGVYFDPQDENDMAEKIEKLLADNKLRADCGARASDRARGFLWRDTAVKTCAVLCEAAEPRSQVPRPPR
ncbi:MAG: glycosyltransferase family 4 protein [Rhodospirillales bacterium]|jgi:glycosyltransferase involved in cell wall biosynthesis|nr:glycosyltransferase family 4 protein [Rhodospirillales bacterium]